MSSSIQTFNPVNYLLHYDKSKGIYEVTLKDLTNFNNQNLLMTAAGRGDASVVAILLQEGQLSELIKNDVQQELSLSVCLPKTILSDY